jgi:hypothetical protein
MRRLALCLVVFACGGLPTPPAPGDLTLAITSPKPGDELVASDQPMIAVTGTVATSSPEFGVLEAWVNGVPVAVDDSGAFTAQVAPSAGVNHLKVEASDGGGELVSQELDVLWAPDYLPTAGGTAFDVGDALDLDLGQRFFDGRMLGTTLDLSTDPVVAHDLAASLELILWNVDLASLLSGGIQVGTGGSSLDISIPSAKPAEILVDAQVVDTPAPAIELSIDLNSVFLGTSGTFQYGGNTLTVAGGLSADMHASAQLALAVQPDGTIAVDVNDVTATVGALVPAFTGPDANTLDGFIEIGNNDFRTLIEHIIQAQLIPTFTDQIPPLLEDLLGATDKLLDNVTFTLDAKLGTPVTVTLDGKIAALDVVPGPAIGQTPGHVLVHQHVSIATDAASPLHPGSRGAARVSATPELPPTNTAGLNVLLSQDFLNALLHALWNSGLLEGSSSFGGLTAQVSAKLPPVVIPTPDSSSCMIGDARCDVIVQLGQIEVQLPDFQQSFAIDATAGARVVVDGATVSLVVQDTPDLIVWETSAKPGRLTDGAVRDLVTTVVWPQLVGALGDKLKITLPIPDLAALGLDSLSPNLANAQLQLDVQQRASVTPGYLGLGADLELQTPHP